MLGRIFGKDDGNVVEYSFRGRVPDEDQSHSSLIDSGYTLMIVILLMNAKGLQGSVMVKGK